MNCKTLKILISLLLSLSICCSDVSIIPLEEESIIRTLPAGDVDYEVGDIIDIYGIYDTSGEFGHLKECSLRDDIFYITKFFLTEEFERGNPDTLLPTVIARVEIVEDDLYGYAFSVKPIEFFRISFHPDELGDYQPGDDIPLVVSPEVPTPSKEINALREAIASSIEEILAIDLTEIADEKTVELLDDFSINEEYLEKISTELIGWEVDRNTIIMKSRGGLIPTAEMNYQSRLILYSIYDCENDEIDRIYITIQTRFLE